MAGWSELCCFSAQFRTNDGGREKFAEKCGGTRVNLFSVLSAAFVGNVKPA
jgi:hypothetical protein